MKHQNVDTDQNLDDLASEVLLYSGRYATAFHLRFQGNLDRKSRITKRSYFYGWI